MRYEMIIQAGFAVVIALGSTGCNSPAPPTNEAESQVLRNQTIKLLENQPEDSDAAIILRRAIEKSKNLERTQADTILLTARKQAQEASKFKPLTEAPLPEGWPKPSLPGLIRIKHYPDVRIAWVRKNTGSNSQFRTLFKHIKKREIAMTSPVVMEYENKAETTKGDMGRPEAMAFLYRYDSQDIAGKFGAVTVSNDKKVTALSVGMKGAYSGKNFQSAIAKLNRWLGENPQWRKSGKPRVLAYNSPFIPFWWKYSEVQIPVVKGEPDR